MLFVAGFDGVADVLACVGEPLGLTIGGPSDSTVPDMKPL